jgi:hypothetical protein
MDNSNSPGGRRPGATILLLVIAGLLSFAAYRVCAVAIADHHARSAPDLALRWVADHPAALLARSRAQLAAGRDQAAAATARNLLARSPAEGGGFAVLAEVAERAGDGAKALQLMRIAARRSPRDLAARGWLAEHAIARGDYARGLDQLDAVMRLSPIHAGVLVPAIAELARDPEFASGLSDHAARHPRWLALVVARLASEPGAEGTLAGLFPAMDAEERNAWIARLLAGHRWGEAYATWAADAIAPGGTLPLVFDPGFSRRGDQGAFGWKTDAAAGVSREREGAHGEAAVALRVDRVQPGARWLSQRLVLPPGHYRFSAHATERGALGRGQARPRWMIRCADGGRLLAETAAIDSHGRQSLAMEFTVPPGCPVQQLALAPDPAAAAGPVSLEYRVGRVALARSELSDPGAGAVLDAAAGLVLAGHGEGLSPVASGQHLPLRGRVLVGPGASARLTLATGCTVQLRGPLVQALPLSCEHDAANAIPAGAASARVRDLRLRDRIAGTIDPRGPIPAGR